MTTKSENPSHKWKDPKLESKLRELSSKQNFPEKSQDLSSTSLVGDTVLSHVWVENSPVCTKIIDPDFNLQYMSHAGISGLKINDVKQYYGKPYPFHFFPEWSKESMIEALNRVKETGETISVETTAADLEGGILWFHTTLTPIHTDDGLLDYIMVVSVDTTQKKLAEKELKRKNEQIEAQNKSFEKLNAELMKSNYELVVAKEKAEESDKLKSAFLANMSHEVRTPLNAILGFVNLLKKDFSIDESERLEFLSYIESGAVRLTRLISDIVDLAKIDSKQLSIQPEDCNLNDLIDNLQAQFSVQIEKKKVSLSIKKPQPNDKSTVRLDKTRVSQILSNLIENAIKFTPEGTIHFGYMVEGDDLHFYVKDPGIGIDFIDHKIIFDRFRQVDTDFSSSLQGTGLGLSIAKELVNLMGGEIWVESKKDLGATFNFTIPLTIPEPVAGDTDNTSNGLQKDSSITILVAEDEPMNFRYIEVFLKAHEYKIIHAKNGKEAVEAVNSNDNINLVLMDLRMPVMDGFEAIKEIKRTHPSLPAIAQSAYALADDERRALVQGFDDYLTKPLTIEDLSSSMLKHLKK